MQKYFGLAARGVSTVIGGIAATFATVAAYKGITSGLNITEYYALPASAYAISIPYLAIGCMPKQTQKFLDKLLP